MESLVEVGGYALEPGNPAGTSIRQGEAAAEAEAGSLRQALEQPIQPSDPAKAALAAEIDEAAEATAKIERAVALCKGVGEGRALSPEQLGLEVSAFLDCLERLDRKQKHKKALQMARALATLLMLLKRWADLLRTLRLALRAGEQLGDQEAVAWAKHELGTLRLAAGDVKGADRELTQAREIRKRIDDRRGLAATERNMQMLCDRLREMLRKEALVRHGPRSGPTAPVRLLAFAALVAVLFGGGVAAGMVASGDSGSENVAAGAAKATGSGTSGNPGGSTGQPDDSDGAGVDTNPQQERESFPLVITVAGEGSGSVAVEGFDCGEGTCEIPAGETVSIVAQAEEGSEFYGFYGSCSTESTPCTLTVTEPSSVTARFSLASYGRESSSDDGEGGDEGEAAASSAGEVEEEAAVEEESSEPSPEGSEIEGP